MALSISCLLSRIRWRLANAELTRDGAAAKKQEAEAKVVASAVALKTRAKHPLTCAELHAVKSQHTESISLGTAAAAMRRLYQHAAHMGIPPLYLGRCLVPTLSYLSVHNPIFFLALCVCVFVCLLPEQVGFEARELRAAGFGPEELADAGFSQAYFDTLDKSKWKRADLVTEAPFWLRCSQSSVARLDVQPCEFLLLLLFKLGCPLGFDCVRPNLIVTHANDSLVAVTWLPRRRRWELRRRGPPRGRHGLRGGERQQHAGHGPRPHWPPGP